MKNVHLVTVSLKRFDGTGDYLLAQRDLMKERSLNALVYSQHVHPNVGFEVLPYEALEAVAEQDLIIYHYGIFDSGMGKVLSAPASRKTLYYHNQTPAYFFDLDNPGMASELRAGLSQLNEASSKFSKFIANSEYTITQAVSRQTLPEVRWEWLPPVILKKFEVYQQCLETRPIDLLCLGRIAPHKKTMDALLIFSHLCRWRPRSKFLIVGSGSGPYYEKVIQAASVIEGVRIESDIDESRRTDLLRQSKALIALSAHEGFGIPAFQAVQEGCLVFYGASECMHQMIHEDNFRVGIDGDHEFAAYKVHCMLGEDGRSLLDRVIKRYRKILPLMDPDIQFGKLANVPILNQRSFSE